MYFNKIAYIKLTIFLLFIFFQNLVFGQTSTRLKEILWRNDFHQMISYFGEDHITLKDPGEIQKQKEARSFIEKEGLRVQVFAGSDTIHAENVARQLQELKLDSVYVIHENNLFKVQIGNFSERLEAEKMLDRLRYLGITNAWIVNATIHVPKGHAFSEQKKVVTREEKIGTKFIYAIQVFVTGSPDKARSLQKALRNKFPYPIWLVQQDQLWKILVGKFQDREKAQQALENIQSSGITDAWITQVND